MVKYKTRIFEIPIEEPDFPYKVQKPLTALVKYRKLKYNGLDGL